MLKTLKQPSVGNTGLIIIAHARRHAAQILRDARKKKLEYLRRSIEKAKEAGMLPVLEGIFSICEMLHIETLKHREKIEKEAADSAFKISKSIVRHELSVNKEAIERRILGAVSHLERSSIQAIFLNPETLKALGDRAPAIQPILKADPTLSPGAIKVRVNGSEIIWDWERCYPIKL